MSNGSTKTLLHSTTDLQAGLINRLVVDLDSIFRADALASEQEWRDNDQAIYPVRLEFATFAFSKDAAKQQYRIPIDGWYLHFGEVAPLPSGVVPVSADTAMTDVCKVCTAGGILIRKGNRWFDILGRPVEEVNSIIKY